MAPTPLTTFQGEVQQSQRHLDLLFTCVAKPMRQALEEFQRNVVGYEAEAYLRKYMNPISYEWLNILLDRYKGHVIEFSCYAQNWGTIPGFNTVWWEVRNY